MALPRRMLAFQDRLMTDSHEMAGTLSDDKKERLRIIFEELKDRELLDGALVFTNETNNPVSISQDGKTVWYSEAFPLPSNDMCTRFVFLHEGGHRKQRQAVKIYPIAVSVVGIAIFIWQAASGGIGSPAMLDAKLDSIVGGIFPPCMAIVTLVLAIIVMVFLGVPVCTRLDEKRADTFAAKCLQKEYHVDAPSLILQQVFLHHREWQENRASQNRSVLAYLSRCKRKATHPSDKNRVRHVMRKVDRQEK